ncbi:exosome catalytic subunit dis3 [Lobulomyces angularis]|nr:exosome catalytic subunit dis3 [Lobulomyces angularis]
MDSEASRRGTTVYLVDKRIDMLPALLGTNLCSLHCNVDRLAFSVIWEITPDAEIVHAEYTKSVIRSRASFTYDEAQARLDDPKLIDPISIGIKTLNMLAKKLRKKRMDKGALVLASPEVRFNLENDSQDPVDVEMKELKDTNALVEEFMLLANIHVAKKISQIFPDSSMLRRHPKPPDSNFEGLKNACKIYDVTLDVTTSKTLADSLDKAVYPKEPYFNKLVRIMTTRCMMQAVYFCSGTLAEPEFWHYGLATEIYTHFTSPIRRYADLVVHRLLAACIGYDKQYSSELVDKSKMSELCQVLNYRHRQAQQAARSSVELYTNLYFKGKTIQEEGFVIRILKNGFNVLIPRYGIEGLVYTSSSPLAKEEEQEQEEKNSTNNNLKKNFFIFDQKNQILKTNEIYTKSKVEIKLFSKVLVRVIVEEAGKQSQRDKLFIRLVEPVVLGFTIPKI